MIDRDFFAAAALTGLLAAPTDKDRSMEYWARLSYEAADAMLRERGDTEPMPKEKQAEVYVTITNAEREAICQAVTAYDGNDDDKECAQIADTLRGLLERTKNA
jgi:hypothetical protein